MVISMSKEKTTPQFPLRPVIPEEKALFFALPEEEDLELGAVGHLRIDFGQHGKEFWHTWWPRGKEEWNSTEFKETLSTLVDALRTDGLLRDIDTMSSYCRANGGEIEGGWTPCYGYVVETEHYRFCLRCIPARGNYNAYLTGYDLRIPAQNLREQLELSQQIGGIS